MALTEYRPGITFTGRIGCTVGESEPAWPMPNRAEPDAPNVLFIVLDDTGYGQIGCYGSPINTPNLVRLAANGLLYTNMHTTALCSDVAEIWLTVRLHRHHRDRYCERGRGGAPGFDRGPEGPCPCRYGAAVN